MVGNHFKGPNGPSGVIISLFRQSNLKHICPLVVLVKNLRNFKIEYLILKGLGLKSSKDDPQTLLKMAHKPYSKFAHKRYSKLTHKRYSKINLILLNNSNQA